MPQNTKITMKRALPLIALLLLCVSCSRTVQRQVPAFRLEADTLRQGGLELLHNIAIVDAEGTVLFTDSTTNGLQSLRGPNTRSPFRRPNPPLPRHLSLRFYPILFKISLNQD